MIRLNRGLALLMALLALNATIGAAVRALQDQTVLEAITDGLGQSFIVWFALLAGLSCLWKEPRTNSLSPPRGGEIGAGLCLSGLALLPSAMVAWCLLACAAALGLWRLPSRAKVAKAGLVVLLALAIREPVRVLLLSVFAGPLLSLDAQLVASGLALFGQASEVMANVVIRPDGHRLLVLTGCSSVTNLSLGLLACLTVLRVWGGPWRWSRLSLLLMTAAALVTINLSRLVVMGISPDWYVWAHDETGAQLFLAIAFVTPFAIAALGVRHVPSP